MVWFRGQWTKISTFDQIAHENATFSKTEISNPEIGKVLGCHVPQRPTRVQYGLLLFVTLLEESATTTTIEPRHIAFCVRNLSACVSVAMAFPFARYVVGAVILLGALCIQVLMTKMSGITVDSRWWQGKIWMDMSWGRLSEELWLGFGVRVTEPVVVVTVSILSILEGCLYIPVHMCA